MTGPGLNWEDFAPALPGIAALARKTARRRARLRALQQRMDAEAVALVESERALAHAIHFGGAGEDAVGECVAKARQAAAREPEAIASVAIMADDGTMVTLNRPARHHHAIFAMTHNGHGHIGPEAQGFATTRGRFVDRREGLAIALASGQVVTKHPSYDMLYSEDMW